MTFYDKALEMVILDGHVRLKENWMVVKETIRLQQNIEKGTIMIHGMFTDISGCKAMMMKMVKFHQKHQEGTKKIIFLVMMKCLKWIMMEELGLKRKKTNGKRKVVAVLIKRWVSLIMWRVQ